MADVLLRRGDLVLATSDVRGYVGLYRDGGEDGSWGPAGQLDCAEWRWVLICAAPCALREIGPEHDHRDPPPPPEQTTMTVF